MAKLAALAAGTGAEPEGSVARAAVRQARDKRRSVVVAAEAAEMDCVQSGGHG